MTRRKLLVPTWEHYSGTYRTLRLEVNGVKYVATSQQTRTKLDKPVFGRRYSTAWRMELRLETALTRLAPCSSYSMSREPARRTLLKWAGEMIANLLPQDV